MTLTPIGQSVRRSMKNSWYIVRNGVLIELEDIGAIRRKERAIKAGLASAKARTGERMKQTKPKAEKKIKRPGHGGVGYPEAVYLEEFGYQVYCAFGDYPYQVGSTLLKKHGWKDVDVRLILSDEEYKNMGFDNIRQPQLNAKWVAITTAWSAYGRYLTGLPIDFQIDQQTYANKNYDGPRSALGVIHTLRYQEKIKQ